MLETTIRLEEDLVNQLTEAAKQQGRSQAELLREALERYLREMRADAPRRFASVGAGEDSELRAKDARELIARAWQER